MLTNQWIGCILQTVQFDRRPGQTRQA
jgi:hypothetical protein